jgi:hypothetical protein
MASAHLSLAVGTGDNWLLDIWGSDSLQVHDVAFEVAAVVVAAAVAVARGSAVEAANVVSVALADASSMTVAAVAADDGVGLPSMKLY